ncbi:hypothetical protein HDK90DRAFT_471905 [Phyllosticta capitalensis]|uniref:Secreted protein n=1 Tax=Phyllosticta capitalensis TaxID=121624 RepID=A0ABR1Z2B9_9PEZI
MFYCGILLLCCSRSMAERSGQEGEAGPKRASRSVSLGLAQLGSRQLPWLLLSLAIEGHQIRRRQRKSTGGQDRR